MSTPERTRLQADLVAYYTGEVRDRAGRELPAWRVRLRAAFVDQLRREGRRRLLEVGCGTGQDGQAFRAAVQHTGVDLTAASVAACRGSGLQACVASVLALPFRRHRFQAAWTMSTLMHLPGADLDDGLAELVRVVEPGAPVAIGVWGDQRAHEGPFDDGSGHGPPRFFSYRTDEQLLATLGRFGGVERFESWPGEGSIHYQWAVLRAPTSRGG